MIGSVAPLVGGLICEPAFTKVNCVSMRSRYVYRGKGLQVTGFKIDHHTINVVFFYLFMVIPGCTGDKVVQRLTVVIHGQLRKHVSMGVKCNWVSCCHKYLYWVFYHDK